MKKQLTLIMLSTLFMSCSLLASGMQKELNQTNDTASSLNAKKTIYYYAIKKMDYPVVLALISLPQHLDTLQNLAFSLSGQNQRILDNEAIREEIGQNDAKIAHCKAIIHAGIMQYNSEEVNDVHFVDAVATPLYTNE